jgi:hypothetical protein
MKTQKKKAKSNEKDNLSLKTYIYLLKIYYSKVLEILDVFARGPIVFHCGALNHYYTKLILLIEDCLNKKGLEDLKNEKPILFESLMGNIEEIDIE